MLRKEMPFLITVCVFLCLATMSCKQIEYIPVPEVHVEHVYHNDTIKVTDSIKHETETIIREARPEDSVLLAKMGLRLQDNERLLILLQRELQQAKSELFEHKSDSVFIHDTIAIPHPVKEVVEKKYTPGFVTFLAWTGGVFLFGILVWAGIKYLIPLLKKTLMTR